jgi:hypothetical protein
MITTPNLGLRVWDSVSDPYSRADLQFNWEALDAAVAAPGTADGIDVVSTVPVGGAEGDVVFLNAANGGFPADTILTYTGSQWRAVGPPETLAAVPSQGLYAGRTVLLSAAAGGYPAWTMIAYDGAAWQKIGGVEILAAVPVTNNYAGRLVLLTAANGGFDAFSLIMYNGSAWRLAESRGVLVGSALPGSPYPGQLFVLSAPASGFSAWEVVRWNGSAWGRIAPKANIVTSATLSTITPTDGYEVVLVDSVTAPTYRWHLIYNSLNSSANKWECIGGNPAGVFGLNGAGVNNWTAIPSSGIALPRAGNYSVEFGFGSSAISTVSYFDFSAQFATVSPTGCGFPTGSFVADTGIRGAGDNSSVTVEIQHQGSGAGYWRGALTVGTLSLGANRGAGNFALGDCWMRVIPINIA